MQTYLLKTGVATLLCLLASFTGATPAQAQKKKKAAPAAEWYRTFQAEGVVKSDRLLSFETSALPDFIHASSELRLSVKHYRDGEQSLRRDYRPGDTLSIRRDLGFEPADPTEKDLYQSAFITWVYNEDGSDNPITFQFLKDGRVCTSFTMNSRFTGWRGAWLLYERDMQGKPEEGMNEIRIIAPQDKNPGRLYFDHLITAAKVDPRQQTADEQLPFVNKGTDNHWLVVYKHSLWKPEISLTPVTEQHKQEFALLEKRFTDLIYTPGKLTEKEMSDIRQRYSYYDIKRMGDGDITGRPVYFVRHSEAYERLLPEWDKDLFTTLDVEFTAYFNLMKRIAVAYRNAETKAHKEELKTMFLAMYDNITDQGVTYGSCWGNAHHYGYSMRGLFVSYFLMKDVLLASGQLDEAERTLRWYAITNEVYPKPTVNGIDIDTFNTKLQGRVASILIMEDTPEKLQYMRSLQRWPEYGCRPAPGLMGSFKADGACFHHCNNYPAYAVGGLDNATQMIYLLSGTEFKLSEPAHRTVKNVLLAMRFYCNLKQWPLSMSGRHPNGGGALIPMHYATMALAGTPDGKQKVDAEMAEAFLRLVQYDGLADKESPEYMPRPSSKQNIAMRSRLQSLGFGAETDPQGNLALGYGCVSAQRRDNWAAVVRGHSRYLWAAEHYLPANFYGRYLAHGSMQILTAPQGREVTFGTGRQEAGFDWNRIPGATAIHLPFDLLRARVLNVDVHSGMEEMLYSDEAFAGGLSHFHRNGNFGMKLHEHDKYNGSLRARKSYHFFDGTIVCLGSDIENLNADYPTETTLFQVCASQDTRGYWDAYRPDADSRTFIDPNGTGFYLSQASARDARFERNFPQVTVGERSTKPTQGDWVNLTLLHGKAPKGAGYEYAVLPKTDAQALKAFARKPLYKVWQRDRQAHIVRSTREDLTSYVLFETPQSLPAEGWLQQADTACLVMIGQESDRLYLTVAQPDLALYRGASDDVYDKDGKRIERSIYSRPWIANESGTIPVTVTLKGCWKPLPASPVRVLESSRKRTVLQFECRESAGYDVMLEKQ